MPVIEVEVVGGEPLNDTLAGELAAGLAPILGGPPSGTWLQLRGLKTTHYAEGDGGPPAGVLPVFVTVIRSDIPLPDDLRVEAAAIAEAVAATCDRPAENVHVIYLPPGRGRVAFGGRLLE